MDSSPERSTIERRPEYLLTEYNILIKERGEEINRAHRYLQMCIGIITLYIGGILALYQVPNLIDEIHSVFLQNIIIHIIPVTVLIFIILYLGPITTSQQIIDYLTIIESELGLNFYTQQRNKLTGFQKRGTFLVVGFITIIMIAIMFVISISTEKIVTDFITWNLPEKAPIQNLSWGGVPRDVYRVFGFLLSSVIFFGLCSTYRTRPKKESEPNTDPERKT